MARTLKREWSNPDGWHIHSRLERKARPAGRLLAVIAEELDGDEDIDTWEAEMTAYENALELERQRDEDSCGCTCRRCLLHDDCGGCLWGHEAG